MKSWGKTQKSNPCGRLLPRVILQQRTVGQLVRRQLLEMTLCFLQRGLRRNIQPQPLVPICMCGAWRKEFKQPYSMCTWSWELQQRFFIWHDRQWTLDKGVYWPILIHSSKKTADTIPATFFGAFHSQFQAQHSPQLDSLFLGPTRTLCSRSYH